MRSRQNNELRPDALATAKAALEATAGWFPYPVEYESVTSAELALAGLARCRRLLMGVTRLHDTGGDVAGAHARSLYEMWISSLFAFFGADEARRRLEANDEIQRRRQATALLESVTPDSRLADQARAVLAAPEPEVGILSVRDMARAVRRLTVATGAPESDFYDQAYLLLYGPESYMTVHGGLEQMRRQIDIERGQIVGDGWTYSGEDRRLDLCTAMVMSLANLVGGALGLDRSQLDAAAAALQWGG